MSLASKFAGITDAGAWYAALETAIGAGGSGGGGAITPVPAQVQTQTQTQTITRVVTAPSTGSQVAVTPDATARRLQILNIIY